MGKFSAILLVLVLASSPVWGVVLEGKVYDYSLHKVDQAIVELSTDPAQRMVSIEGAYRFEVPPGNYTLKASRVQGDKIIGNISQEVSVASQGDFTVDLILSPVIEIDEGSLEGVDVTDIGDILSGEEASAQKPASLPYSQALIVGVVMGVFGVVYYMRRRRSLASVGPVGAEKDATPSPQTAHQAIRVDEFPPKAGKETFSERPDLAALLRVMGEHEGRLTQKDLRKALPFSEAKISLMVAELEHEDRLTKIRKGRGNILILKK